VGEHLSSKCGTLSSNSSTIKKKKKKRRRRRRRKKGVGQISPDPRLCLKAINVDSPKKNY
jgi:hypothetical protein